MVTDLGFSLLSLSCSLGEGSFLYVTRLLTASQERCYNLP
jgi:hypothetical protein